MVSQGGNDSEDEKDCLDPAVRAFVVVKHRERCRVVDLQRDEAAAVGSDAKSRIHIDAEGVAPHHGTLSWDGTRLLLQLHDEGSDNGSFLNGKRITLPSELKPGDEITIGSVQLVVGVSVPPSASGRRALTHHEFRERLWEEVARAARGGRPTALVMVQARAGDGKRVAATALDSFRAGDVVGTYSHDELEFLLPDTETETARSVVERVLSRAEVHGAHAGIAVAPEHGGNPERLIRASRRALERSKAEALAMATPPPRARSAPQPESRDPATRELVLTLAALAPRDVSVLLTGELSSGKAMFARFLHDTGPRASRPFVVISCESFGSSDAFARAGLGSDGQSQVSHASGGTLLLDEVGELCTEAQQWLKNALKAHGGGVRVIATTHRALGGLVERGAFDPELYDQIASEIVDVPPLRSRPEEIIPLAERFASEFGVPPPVSLSAGALARLRSHPWPGNVLELRNAMERAVRLAGQGEILAEHLPSDALPVGGGEGRLREHVDSVERDAIIKALADSNYNQTHSAKRLGVSRRALIYKMEKYGLKPPPGAVRSLRV